MEKGAFYKDPSYLGYSGNIGGCSRPEQTWFNKFIHPCFMYAYKCPRLNPSPEKWLTMKERLKITAQKRLRVNQVPKQSNI